MPASLIQSTFQFGEVSELLHARVDSPIYYRSVKRLRNMLVVPQGGCERRFGTEEVEAINNHAGPPVYLTDYTQIKPYIFDHISGDRYLLIFRPLAIDVYFNNVYQSTVVSTYSSAEISQLGIAQSANIVFITHSSHIPATLIRSGTGPVTMTLNAAPVFTAYPTFDFVQNYSATVFQVTIAGVAMTTAQNILGQPVDIIVSTTTWTANYVGGLFFADGGVIRITGFVDGGKVNGRILNTFDPESSLFSATLLNAITGADVVITEKAFSATRGYPSKVAFFQNRIFFGNTPSLPGGIWGSNYNGYNAAGFTFDDSAALDINAISTVLQGTKATSIEHLMAFKTLLVFTTSGMYSTPLLVELPLVPTNISFINLQTSDSANNVVPLVLDNDVIFFHRGGRKVKNVNIAEPTQHYQTRTISVLAPHLVDQPYSAGVFENSSTKDGSWLFMTNTGDSNLLDDTEMDGALSIYQSVPEQEITAWSLATTEGKFRHVASDEELVYFIVERVINGQTRLFIEQLNFDCLLDCSALDTQALSSTITGLSYLEGATVRVRGKNDDMESLAVMSSQVVTGGQITVDFPVTSYEVGLDWHPSVVPLPLNIPTPYGNNLYMPKTVKRLYVDFYQSLGIKVDNELIPPFRFEVDTYDNAPIPKTDFVPVEPMNGWDPRDDIVISQSDPLPMTLIGLGFQVML